MPPSAGTVKVVEAVAAADNWNKRVALVRAIPEEFGTSYQQDVYAAIADYIYVPDLAPDFAYVHWRDEYELQKIEEAYEKAYALTSSFVNVNADDLAKAIATEPKALRIFRLLLGFTTQEFAASTVIAAAELGHRPLSNSVVKAMENGSIRQSGAANVAASTVDRAMRGELFAEGVGGVRSKISKPDTIAGWATVQRYAAGNVPFPVFLHQRYYGGAFRQLLDATSSVRGNILEEAVEELFDGGGIGYVRTGAKNQAEIAERFGLTVKPAPDFAVYDAANSLRAILECKQANDGGTARDKAARFRGLRAEATRLGGIPVFAVLAGLGWRRTADALGPVIRDTDGRVFTVKTIALMLTVDPFPTLTMTSTK